MATNNIEVLANHFNVTVPTVNGFFYHYRVTIKNDNKSSKAFDEIYCSMRGIVQRVFEQEPLQGMNYVYDGRENIFIIGHWPPSRLEFDAMVDWEDGKSPSRDSFAWDSKRPLSLKIYCVELKYVSEIPIQAVMPNSERYQEAVRVLHTSFRHTAAQKWGCLQLRQFCFTDRESNFVDLGGGLLCYRGFHSSFRPNWSGLSLNMDASSTIIVKPGPVIDYLLLNQNVDHYTHINWAKAKKALKNLRIKATNTRGEHMIIRLTDLPCMQQMLSPQQSVRFGAQEGNITVYDYFVNHLYIPLDFSAELPCLCVGHSNNYIYMPIELCTLVPLQRYTKALTNLQRTAFLEKSQMNPFDMIATVNDAMSNNASNHLLQSLGVVINPNLIRIKGHVLSPPQLRVGNGQEIAPLKGKWSFNNKKLLQPVILRTWAVVNFSAHCNLVNLCEDMFKCWKMKGLTIELPQYIEENPQFRSSPAPIRVDKMFQMIKKENQGRFDFILCVLPEKKKSDLYGPWKRESLRKGYVTQCIARPARINNQYMTNVLLKINAKLGGLNSILTMEHNHSITGSMVFVVPTLIVGMSVSHGSAGQLVPSVAAVVGSTQWPLISKYKAAVHSQLPRSAMIDGLFKPVSSGSITDDKGMFRELLIDFCKSSNRKPKQIIIFRNGVSESQFKQVLDVELKQIIKACRSFDEKWKPKFLVVVAQKNHHTKFFQEYSRDNVSPGTVIDETINHPKYYDFYMCAHASMIGTTRPTHYIILKDDIGWSPPHYQELVHSLSYVHQRGTTAISVAAPLYYARLAATHISRCIEFDEISKEAKFPVLHENIRNTMFFC